MQKHVKKALSLIAKPLRGERVVVACSGGADSVALCKILYSLRETLGFEMVVAHYNHAMRGGEAERDEGFVRDLAGSRGLPFISERLDWHGRKFSENAAREARYGFLRRAAQEQKARWVALGHNSDDVVETLLINLLRGSGSAGLKGIAPTREDIFIRPLLRVRRAEIRAYIAENGLTFVEDSSNTDTHYLRNKIRHELLAVLEQEYNPRARVHLRQTAEVLAQENDYIDEQAQRALDSIWREDGAMRVDLLRTLHPALLARVLSKMIERHTGSRGGIYYEHIQSMQRLLATTEGSQEVRLSQSIKVRREYNSLFVFQNEQSSPPLFPKRVEVPSLVEAAGMRLHFSVVPAAQARFDDPAVAFLDYDKVKEPLSLRCWRAGDAIKPLGMKGQTRKLQDIFTDKKVPATARKSTPILVDVREVLWVPRLAISDGARLDERSQRALKIAIL